MHHCFNSFEWKWTKRIIVKLTLYQSSDEKKNNSVTFFSNKENEKNQRSYYTW